MSDVYKVKKSLPNKLLQDDGTITDFEGNLVESSSEEYDSKRAIPNKLLNPDGTYSTFTEILVKLMDTALFIVVDELPEVGLENKIYLLDTGAAGLDEYVYVEGEWHKMGEMTLDLSNYTTTEEVEQMIKAKGYLTEELDPTVPKYVKDITEDNINSWNSKVDEESDPTVPAHVKNIKELDINNWNNKVSEEEDPSVPQHVKDITEEDINNWNNKSEFSGNYNDLEDKPDMSSKYDKTGGTIDGDVNIKGALDLKIEDEDYDSGIKFKQELNNNYGTILTLTGYANSEGEATNYKPIIRDVNTPVNNYDVANKKYVDDNIVIPNYYLVFLNDNGTVDTTSSSLNYETVKTNLTDPLKEDILDVIWGTTRFYAECIEITDVNNGDIKFIADIEYQGIERRIVFTLEADNVLSTTLITTPEIISNKTQDIVSNGANQTLYPSAYAVYNQFQRKPEIIYDDPTGFEASNSDVGDDWHLTGLDLSPYKRLKFYVKPSGTSNDNWTPSHVVEMHLEDRAKGSSSIVAGHMAVNPNNRNRIHAVTFAVKNDLTSIQFVAANSLYGTASTSASGGRTCYLIEGYYD